MERENTNSPKQLQSAKSIPAPNNNIKFTIQQKPVPVKNTTGLPDNLKKGIENLSGIDISDVKVHYNSSQPAQLNAHAYAQGNQIYVALGQEKHLPHEAWHVVQQKQGRVKPTKQLKGKVNINDDISLEKEADIMGAKAIKGGYKFSSKDIYFQKQDSSISLIQGQFIPAVQNQIGAIRLMFTEQDKGRKNKILTLWSQDNRIHRYNSPQEVVDAINDIIRIYTNAHEIGLRNNQIIQQIIRTHDISQSNRHLPGYNTQLLERAFRLNLLASQFRNNWQWYFDWTQRLIDLDWEVINSIQQVLDNFGIRGLPQMPPPEQEPIAMVDWGHDSVNHLINIKDRLQNVDFDTRHNAIGVLRGADDEEAIQPSEQHPYVKGAILRRYILSSRQAILNLVHQVGDSVAIFSLERGGSLLADHISDLMIAAGLQTIPNVKVSKRSGLIDGQYNRTMHHRSMILKMMDTEEGQLHKLITRNPMLLQHPPLITIALAETAVSGSSVNTLLGTLQTYHQLLPYSKFRLLIEKQTIKEQRLHNHPLGGLRVADPGIVPVGPLTVDTIPKIQMFISQTEYILGEDVGYQVSYDGRHFGAPIIIFDQSLNRLVAVKISKGGVLPRDLIRMLIRGVYDQFLNHIFDQI